jgi:excisionase family DNA binding protein
MTTQLPDQAMFSPSDIAMLFSVSRRTVLRWIADGRLGAYRVSTTVRITHDDLQAFLDQHRLSSDKEAANAHASRA